MSYKYTSKGYAYVYDDDSDAGTLLGTVLGIIIAVALFIAPFFIIGYLLNALFKMNMSLFSSYIEAFENPQKLESILIFGLIILVFLSLFFTTKHCRIKRFGYFKTVKWNFIFSFLVHFVSLTIAMFIISILSNQEISIVSFAFVAFVSSLFVPLISSIFVSFGAVLFLPKGKRANDANDDEKL